jgi:hypothetical protein
MYVLLVLDLSPPLTFCLHTLVFCPNIANTSQRHSFHSITNIPFKFLLFSTHFPIFALAWRIFYMLIEFCLSHAGRGYRIYDLTMGLGLSYI